MNELRVYTPLGGQCSQLLSRYGITGSKSVPKFVYVGNSACLEMARKL